MNVGIYLFPEVEALDFAGPYEVFTTCSRVSKRLTPHQPAPFAVFSVADQLQPVQARAGLRLVPDYQLSAHPDIDILIVPGGVITQELRRSTALEWVRRQSEVAKLTASVCTGAFILAQAGVLTCGPVTTHWEDLQELADMFPSLQVIEGPRWIDQGHVMTSAGISAGIDMCLHIVSRLCSETLAQATARQMDYPWKPVDRDDVSLRGSRLS